jgi:hypothetical protein
MSKIIKVRWHPQYRGSANGGIITGYRVYAYIGHPLLGEIRGTEKIVKTESLAKKEALKLRKWAKESN